MMPTRTIRFFVGMVISLSIGLAFFSESQTALPISAQPAEETPIVVLIENDIWTYTVSTKTWTRLTTWRYNREPVIAPLGDQVAYNSWATEYVELINQGAALGGLVPPSNIWVLDIDSGDGERIAAQPANVSIENGIYITRSTPSYSPDGAKIAWTELEYPGERYYIAVYNRGTRQTQRISLNFNGVFGIPAPPDVRFGPDNTLALQWTGPDIATSDVADFIGFYNAKGDLLGTAIMVLNMNAPRDVRDFVWLKDGTQDKVGVLMVDGGWRLANPINGGSWAELISRPALIPTVDNSDTRLSFVPTNTPQTAVWTIHFFNINTLNFPYQDRELNGISFSPDGDQIAFINAQRGLSIWQNGITTMVPHPENKTLSALVWTHPAWIVDVNGTVATTDLMSNELVCASAPASRMMNATVGQVSFTDGRPLNVRATPNGNQLLQLPEGAIFTLVSGPQCEANLVWWQIRTMDGTVGWVAEGDTQFYFIEPVQ